MSDRVSIDVDEVWPDDVEEDVGIVVDWFVSDGSSVEAGDTLCEIQIEKVSLDISAPVDGTLAEIIVEEDGEFERGDALGWIEPT